MKNRALIGIICIVLAIAVMFAISPLVNKLSAEKVNTYQVNKNIEQGQIITSEDVVKTTIGAYGVLEGYITAENQLIGKYAKSDIYPNVNIYPAMLSDKADSADDIFSSLDGTKVAMSITIPSFANGLSGKLQNGDIVSVVVTKDTGSTTPAELTYVKVITSTTSKGTDSNEIVPNEDGTTDLPSTVTLLVNPTQANLLGGFEQTAKMHLTLVYRGDDENSDKFLAEQEKVFEEQAEETEKPTNEDDTTTTEESEDSVDE